MQNIIWQKIEALQQEIEQLKSLYKKPKKNAIKKNKSLSIEGLLKGIKFSDREINEAQKAIFSHSEDHIK